MHGRAAPWPGAGGSAPLIVGEGGDWSRLADDRLGDQARGYAEAVPSPRPVPERITMEGPGLYGCASSRMGETFALLLAHGPWL